MNTRPDVFTGQDLEHLGLTIQKRLLTGAVGILPTDTIYGLTANAFDQAAVHRIDAIKRRSQPATVVPHDLGWAASVVEPSKRAWVEVLMEAWPGATLLMPYAPDGEDGAPHQRLASSLTSSGLVGMRRPQHWLSELAWAVGVPLVTSSVNRTTQPPMTSLDDLDPGLAAEVDFIVYTGPLRGKPSPIWFCDEDEPRLLERG